MYPSPSANWALNVLESDVAVSVVVHAIPVADTALMLPAAVVARVIALAFQSCPPKISLYCINQKILIGNI